MKSFHELEISDPFEFCDEYSGSYRPSDLLEDHPLGLIWMRSDRAVVATCSALTVQDLMTMIYLNYK